MIHLMHIPKTGGTALGNALKTVSGIEGKVIVYPHSMTLPKIPIGEQYAFIVRDPITRFIAGFYDMKTSSFRARSNKTITENVHHDYQLTAFDRFETPNDLAEGLTQDDYEARISSSRAFSTIPRIRESYWRWFSNEEYFKSRMDGLHTIFFQETLAQDFEDFKERLELPKKLKLPTDHLARKDVPDANYFLSEDAKRNLTLWYKEDIRFFDICKQHCSRHHLEPFNP